MSMFTFVSTSVFIVLVALPSFLSHPDTLSLSLVLSIVFSFYILCGPSSRKSSFVISLSRSRLTTLQLHIRVSQSKFNEIHDRYLHAIACTRTLSSIPADRIRDTTIRCVPYRSRFLYVRQFVFSFRQFTWTVTTIASQFFCVSISSLSTNFSSSGSSFFFKV